MNGAVSREAVLNLCTNDKYYIPYEYEDDKGIHRGYDEYRLINYYKLKQLPPVTQKPDEQLYKNGFADGYEQGYKDAQQKHGKWIAYEVRLPDRTILNYRCSVCGRKLIGYNTETLSEAPFCHCGARMIGPQESEEEK